MSPLRINYFFKLPRWLLAITSIIALAILGWTSWQSEERLHMQQDHVFANPERYAGNQVVLRFIYIEEKKNHQVIGVDARNNTYYLNIENPGAIKLNKYYSLVGALQSNGTIQVEKYQLHPHRFWKYSLSLLSLIFVLYYIITSIRWGKDGLYLKNISN
jgi:hypothetical protein